MNKNLLIFLRLTASIILATIAPQMANAQTSSTPKVVGLGFDAGTTITWSDSNEVIQQMWLDNPTFATIDIYGCITGWNSCTTSDAQIIHLKRNEDLKLEKIPYANETLLTVITKDMETGKTSLHFYNIKKYSRTANTLIVAAKTTPEPTAAIAQVIPEQKFGLAPDELAQKIDAAVAQAQEEQILERNTKSSLVRLSSLLKLGMAEPQALAMSGVSEALVKQIILNQ
jgi:hypothetical protein